MSTLPPTYRGFVANIWDALILFEACLQGILRPVPWRPYKSGPPTESGDIFIYDEKASGIKRWTDAKKWSPSRVLDRFLIYREVEEPVGSGGRKRVAKRKRTETTDEPSPKGHSDLNGITWEEAFPIAPTANEDGSITPGLLSSKRQHIDERALIGSLVDSYDFRPGGLVKKTISISLAETTYHMVSYYKVDDVRNHKLRQPLLDDGLRHFSIRPQLLPDPRLSQRGEGSEHCTLTAHLNGHSQTTFSAISQHHDTIGAGHPLQEETYPSMSGHISSATLPEPKMLETCQPIQGIPIHVPTTCTAWCNTKDPYPHEHTNSWSPSFDVTGTAPTLTQSGCVLPAPNQHCGMLSEPPSIRSEPEGPHSIWLQHGEACPKSSSMVYYAERNEMPRYSTVDIR